MSQNTNNSQENTNLLQREKGWQDLVLPPESSNADKLYKESVYKVLRCLMEVVSDLKNNSKILKKYGYGECLFGVNAIKKQVQIFEIQLNDCE